MEVSFFNFKLKINNTSIRLYENEKDVGGMSCCNGINPTDIKILLNGYLLMINLLEQHMVEQYVNFHMVG